MVVENIAVILTEDVGTITECGVYYKYMGEKEKQKHLTRAVRGNLGGLIEAWLDSPVLGTDIRLGVVINRGLRAVSLDDGKEMQVDVVGQGIGKRSRVWVYKID